MSGRDSGFTLLEVLLAITVLGVILAMLTLSLSVTLQVIEATERQEEVFFQAQTALRRITEDLNAAVAGEKEGLFVGEKAVLDGRRADRIRFTSAAHLIFNPQKQHRGPAVIWYRLRMDEEDERSLRLLRTDIALLPGVSPDEEQVARQAFLLADGVRSVRFAYFDANGQEFDSWPAALLPGEAVGSTRLPAAVHCTLEFWLDPDEETSQIFSTRVLLPAEGESEN